MNKTFYLIIMQIIQFQYKQQNRTSDRKQNRNKNKNSKNNILPNKKPINGDYETS